MTKNKNQILALVTLLSGLAYASPVHAQSVNYGALQDLFGEPITTSATGTPQRASEVAADMTIITADQIRQSGSRSIPEILERVPGMDVLQTSNTNYDVGVRGYQQVFQPRLLVLVDGRQVFIDDYSRTVWSNIPVNIDDIRQIEVVKGASSALFGSNAAGGVVNIVTYNPQYDQNEVAAVSYGSQNHLKLDGSGTLKLGDRGGVKLSVGGSNADEFHTDKNPAADLRDSIVSNRYAVGSASFQVAPKVQANSEFTYSTSRENPVIPSFYGATERMVSYSMKGGLAWQSPFGLITNNNYINHSFARGLGLSYNADYSTQLIVSQLEDQFKIGQNNSFRAALEYRNKYHRLETAQVFAQAPAFEQNDYAVSGTWLSQITPVLSWTNAFRYDHQDMAQTGTLFADAFENNSNFGHALNELSVNSGLVYKATELDSFRANYGRGVQLPSFLQEGLATTLPLGGATFLDIEGNPHLKTTIVQNYGLGYDRVVPDFFSTLKLSLFYELNQDIVGFDAGFFTRTVGGNTYVVTQSTNVGNSRGFGSELELAGSHDGFRWDTSYSYARAVDEQGVAASVGYDGSAPKHHFRLSGGYTTGPWEIDANSNYVTSTHMLRASMVSAFAPVTVDGYFNLGGRIGYNIDDHFTVALVGTNIQTNKVATSPYPSVERQAFLTLTGKF